MNYKEINNNIDVSNGVNTILNQLNDKQKEAVLAIEGPILIIAGAGSGKTRALTHRVAYLISKGVRTENILAVTFTNKAAQEMAERINTLITNNQQPITNNTLFIGTFHSFCAKILRNEALNLKYTKYFTIFDDSDSMSLLKEVMKELNINSKQFPAPMIMNIISGLKSELIGPEQYEGRDSIEPFPKTIYKIYSLYENRLKESNAFDFDDLIMKTVELFRRYPKILEKYQERFRYIHIDEYQDTNTAQYELTRILALKHKNLFVIGDDAQCLPQGTLIETKNGRVPIEKISPADKIRSATGFGKTTLSKIVKIHRRNGNEFLMRVKTSSGKSLAISAGHIVFAKLKPDPNIFYVYLMERKDKGFRIGHTRGVRMGSKNGLRVIKNGIRQCLNQEGADKIWILKTASTKEEAVFYEQLLAFTYGIPTTVFYDKGRNIPLNQASIDLLFSKINTRQRIERLFSDLSLSTNHPHHRPRGITRNTAGLSLRYRATIDVCFFGGSQKSKRAEWHGHRIALISGSNKLKRRLKRFSLWTIRQAKTDKKSWRIETARQKYEDCIEFAKKLASACELEIHEKARLSNKKDSFDLMPASHLHPGMAIAVSRNGQIKEETIISISKKHYRGTLYDLSVENTHNYSANGIVVHNSIYSWRNADFRNILNFERDWPDAKVIVLDENYRSTKTILETANSVIAQNLLQKPKNLWTKNSEGAKIEYVILPDERQEAGFVAEKIQELLKGGCSLKDIAVLYRTNAQSRAIEESLLEENIPYKIIGGIKFYQRKEIKDIIAYLRLFLNPNDLVSLKRIINVPARGIGKITFLKFLQSGNKISGAGNLTSRTNGFGQNVDITRMSPLNNADYNSKEQSAIQKFEKTIEELRESLKSLTLPLFIKELIKKIKYEEYLEESFLDFEMRVENIKELQGLARRFTESEPIEGLAKMLEEISLAQDQDEIKEKNNLLHLMTLHAAKGLEFKFVFITGMEEGIFPNTKSMFDPSSLEEERRLCYVGITRSKEGLWLLRANQRQLWGDIQKNIESRFLKEIPKTLLNIADFSGDEYDDDEGEEIIF